MVDESPIRVAPPLAAAELQPLGQFGIALERRRGACQLSDIHGSGALVRCHHEDVEVRSCFAKQRHQAEAVQQALFHMHPVTEALLLVSPHGDLAQQARQRHGIARPHAAPRRHLMRSYRELKHHGHLILGGGLLGLLLGVCLAGLTDQIQISIGSGSRVHLAERDAQCARLQFGAGAFSGHLLFHPRDLLHDGQGALLLRLEEALAVVPEAVLEGLPEALPRPPKRLELWGGLHRRELGRDGPGSLNLGVCFFYTLRLGLLPQGSLQDPHPAVDERDLKDELRAGTVGTRAT
mmetsp:Transcript_35458/g.111590  ORF Transcript_35458/g.111590 Transcript_35458/m.111590 type:complete len:293 (-) Transcript_35458:526-1404(-)